LDEKRPPDDEIYVGISLPVTTYAFVLFTLFVGGNDGALSMIPRLSEKITRIEYRYCTVDISLLPYMAFARCGAIAKF
jgi:hypothetical protein